ncbi:BatA domain-containing protein [Paludisphaera mucosa]|uniref:BatA domain-containing protein n=1 Tax=Paludisphaera mucosa TaxID=3030827 RepID=A0ABT6FDC1_9BACT|nr:BatA domain-containing protein [Paludisphaera mucosa]MDG3005537.1 BatA domain-containing protein [Paludisphaera mucosa]
MPTFAPLLALGFANAGLLYGLAAASIPILIHLLNRRKRREVRWAAMRFLTAALAKNQRRIRIEQWLLLALRCLLVALVVGAMAKPFLETFGNVIPGRRTHRVIVMDASMSMAARAGGTTRFDQAKAVAAQLVKDSRRGDAISLVLMGDPPRVVVGDPSPNLDEVRKEVGELTQGQGGVDLAATFEAVERVLEASTISQKELVFLSDLQSTSWRPRNGDAGGDEGLKRAIAKIEARRPRSTVIDLGKAGAGNRAVVGLSASPPVVTPGTTVVVTALVRNFGPSPFQGVRVRLTTDGRVGPEQVVDLPVGEDVPVVFNQQFPAPGDRVVEASIDEDSLPPDDRRLLVATVREAVRVLLVDGDFKTEAFQAETDFLAQALAPGEESGDQPDPMRVEVVPESQLARRDLGAYDVVGLCNVAQFSPVEVKALEDFLEQGGGVVVFGGDQVSAENYNRLLFADGKGVLPASIGETVGDAAKKEAAFRFNPLGFRHPILAAFRNQADPVVAGLTQTQVWSYHKLTIPKDSTAQVALAFDDGDPAVIEAPRRRGKVFQVALPADIGWSNWPAHRSYPPVMHDLVMEAASGRQAERTIRVGRPFDQSFPAAAAGAPVTIIPPGGGGVAVKLKAEGGLARLHYEQTDAAGAYQVKLGPPVATELAFAANPDPAESDPAKLERAGLAERLPGWKFVLLDDGRELARSAASVGRRGELHRPLLFGVLALLMLESFAAWRFGRAGSR